MSQTDVQVSGRPDALDAHGTQSPKKEAVPRLYALDALRVLAALSVLLFHFTGVDAATRANWGVHPKELFPWLFPVTSYGSYGVQLFFIISGFVICLSAWNRTPGSSYAPGSCGCSPPTGSRLSSLSSSGACCRTASAPRPVSVTR